MSSRRGTVHDDRVNLRAQDMQLSQSCSRMICVALLPARIEFAEMTCRISMQSWREVTRMILAAVRRSRR